MQLELANYSRSATTDELQHTVFMANEKKLSAVAVPPYFVQQARELTPVDSQLQIISPVDFPYGIEGNIVRLNSIAEAGKRGANIVELTINNNYIADKKFKQIIEDIAAAKILCNTKKLELRAILEYRLFEVEVLVDLARKIYTAGIKTIVVGTATFVDDPYDNILLAKEIATNTKAKVICNSSFRTQEHIDNCSKAKIYGMRFNSSIIVEKLLNDSKNGV